MEPLVLQHSWLKEYEPLVQEIWWMDDLRRHLIAEMRWKKSGAHSPVIHCMSTSPLFHLDQILCYKFHFDLGSRCLDFLQRLAQSQTHHILSKDILDKEWKWINRKIPHTKTLQWQLTVSDAWQDQDGALFKHFLYQWSMALHTVGHFIEQHFQPPQSTLEREYQQFLKQCAAFFRQVRKYHPNASKRMLKVPKNAIAFPISRPELNIDNVIRDIEQRLKTPLLVNLDAHLLATLNESEILYDTMQAIAKTCRTSTRFVNPEQIKVLLGRILGRPVDTGEIVLACNCLHVLIRVKPGMRFEVGVSFYPEISRSTAHRQWGPPETRRPQWTAVNSNYVNVSDSSKSPPPPPHYLSLMNKT